jgi:hypothetical protein
MSLLPPFSLAEADKFLTLGNVPWDLLSCPYLESNLFLLDI